MDENNVWKIEKAGLYCFGHAGSTFINVEISRPGAGWSFRLRVAKAREFLEMLGIDDEDGRYVHEVLKGKYVTVVGKDGRSIGVPVGKVGDPYGIKMMDVGE